MVTTHLVWRKLNVLTNFCLFAILKMIHFFVYRSIYERACHRYAIHTIFYNFMHIIVICCIQIFKKEEQNFVFANEIDNMALIMPSQDKHATVAAPEGKAEAKPKGKRRSPKKMEMSASLNVACLKRLLPIGLNMFGGREQELIQQSKQMLIDVSAHLHFVVNSSFLDHELISYLVVVIVLLSLLIGATIFEKA